jgi:hypothetical protein
MSSTRMQGCYPAAGTSKVGDEIRKRRGERGITALDGVLLNNPDIAVSIKGTECLRRHSDD